SRGITRPVPTLVVMPHKRCDFCECRMLSDHVRADVRMAPHDLPLLLTERPRLVQNVVANANLAEAVYRSRCPDQLDLTIAQLQLLSQPPVQIGLSNVMRLG